MAVGISLLIRTFNSEKILGVLLSKIRLAENDEIIVVDSGSRDSTLSIAKEYEANIIIAPPPFHYSKSLNLGFHTAKNPWVLVISSHSIPMVDNFLGIFRSAVADFPDDVVVGYAPSTLNGRSDPCIAANKISYFSKDDYGAVLDICGNANTIYRYSAWESLLFDETIITAEDKKWLKDILTTSKRFCYIPQARCINRNQYSLLYMFWKGYRDTRAGRRPSQPPMPIRHLLGSLKKLVLNRLRGEIDSGNFIRICASKAGQYLASFRSPTNSMPPRKATR